MCELHRQPYRCTAVLRVEHQTSEIERLELMIAETKNSIEKYKGQGVSTDTQRKKVLRGLEEQLSITEVSHVLMSYITNHHVPKYYSAASCPPYVSY